MTHRIIKFRIWDKTLKCYSMPGDSIFERKRSLRGLISYNIDGLSSNFILQQFTGLFDKNGKEIYEGDITKLHDKIFEVLNGSYFTKNDVGHGIHLAENGNKDNFPETICNLDSAKIEIIGNIFENPELLKSSV